MNAGKIIGIMVIIAATGFGVYGYAFYDSANKINVEFDSISVSDINLLSVSLKIRGTAYTKGLVSVSIDEAIYSLSIDGVDFGTGKVTEFQATKDGGEFAAIHKIAYSDLNEEAIAIIFELLDGQEKMAKITISEIKSMGITFEYEIVVEEPISLDDL
jgi:hypothetical protein